MSDSIRIDFKKEIFKARLRFFKIKESKQVILYVPTLEMSAYGDTEEEAHTMLKDQLDDFSSAIISIGEINAAKELAQLGWNKEKYFKKRFKAEAYIDKQGVLHNFDLPEETVIEEEVMSL